ncbi:hypothetical protein TRFO_15004 [Tritrichomonas foetus]|uniref:Protein kinase domain-containing protein n=1 Tax=Tritrichomonas foetus TaxID=1144522 RepID=A0A1J4KTX7_9EUKA|nr:hypothetical protein TRFO_15004 [Tritrichomonas foetus]|eukprot:OHT14594.1 hypothetical protein TRFO_15004 [Tritrichomonas foetus]
MILIWASILTIITIVLYRIGTNTNLETNKDDEQEPKKHKIKKKCFTKIKRIGPNECIYQYKKNKQYYLGYKIITLLSEAEIRSRFKLLKMLPLYVNELIAFINKQKEEGEKKKEPKNVNHQINSEKESYISYFQEFDFYSLEIKSCGDINELILYSRLSSLSSIYRDSCFDLHDHSVNKETPEILPCTIHESTTFPTLEKFILTIYEKQNQENDESANIVLNSLNQEKLKHLDQIKESIIKQLICSFISLEIKGISHGNITPQNILIMRNINSGYEDQDKGKNIKVTEAIKPIITNYFYTLFENIEKEDTITNIKKKEYMSSDLYRFGFLLYFIIEEKYPQNNNVSLSNGYFKYRYEEVIRLCFEKNNKEINFIKIYDKLYSRSKSIEPLIMNQTSFNENDIVELLKLQKEKVQNSITFEEKIHDLVEFLMDSLISKDNFSRNVKIMMKNIKEFLNNHILCYIYKPLAVILEILALFFKKGIIFGLFQNLPLSIHLYELSIKIGNLTSTKLHYGEYLFWNFFYQIQCKELYIHYLEEAAETDEFRSHANFLLGIEHLENNPSEYFKKVENNSEYSLPSKSFLDYEQFQKNHYEHKCDVIKKNLQSNDKFTKLLYALMLKEKHDIKFLEYLMESISMGCDLALFTFIHNVDDDDDSFKIIIPFIKRYMRKGSIFAYAQYAKQLYKGKHLCKDEDKAQMIGRMLLKCKVPERLFSFSICETSTDSVSISKILIKVARAVIKFTLNCIEIMIDIFQSIKEYLDRKYNDLDIR